jgi:hypothetical protein
VLLTKQNAFLHVLRFDNAPSNRSQKFIFSVPHNKIDACEPIQICETYSHQLINGTTPNTKETLTDIIHRIIRRIQRLAIDRQGEKNPERCFAPLKIRVHGCELSGDVVSGCWCDPRAKSGLLGPRIQHQWSQRLSWGCSCSIVRDHLYAVELRLTLLCRLDLRIRPLVSGAHELKK